VYIKQKKQQEERQRAEPLDQAAAPAFAAPGGLYAKEQDGEERKGRDNPASPREAHFSVELIAVHDFVLYVRAIDATPKSGGDAGGASGPEDPNQDEPSQVTAYADDDGRGPGAEEAGVDDGENQGQPSGEADEPGAIPDAGVEVVMMLVISDGEPGRDGCRYSGKDRKEDERSCMAASDI